MAEDKPKYETTHVAWGTVHLDGRNDPIEIRLKQQAFKFNLIAIWTPPKGDTCQPVTIEGTDIEKLLIKAQQEVCKLHKIKWNKKLHVTLNSSFNDTKKFSFVSQTCLLAKIELEVSPVSVGVDLSNKPVYRTSEHDQALPGRPEVGARQSESWSDKDMRALVDDTPENREAFKQIVEGFQLLQKRLCDLLNPQQIEQTVIKIKAGQKLIPHFERKD